MRPSPALALGLVLAAVLIPTSAQAAYPSPVVVSADADDNTPQLVATTAVPRPHVDAIAELRAGTATTMFAGGDFDTIAQSANTYSRVDLVAFDAATGAVSTRFNPSIVGTQVWALATDPQTNSVYVAGQFTSVDGVSRPTLAKLNATTGAVDRSFNPPFRGGRITDLELATLNGTKYLIIGGKVGKKLMALDPATGKDTGYLGLPGPITDAIPGAWGGVAVYQFALDPSGTHLAVTGNFSTVAGQARTRFVMLRLTAAGASVDSWYYPGFAKPCTSTAPRRVAYLQGVDWSPDGSAITVSATGQIPKSPADIWYHRLGNSNKPNTTVCDAVGRFALADPTKPLWINYTGGDSVWVVADTGAAVYAQGHFKWLDNPDGYASLGIGDKTSRAPAASRRGIGSIDPATGLANSWNPGVVSRTGGKALLATSTGLWVGNDSTRFGTERHYGIAFAPR